MAGGWEGNKQTLSCITNRVQRGFAQGLPVVSFPGRVMFHCMMGYVHWLGEKQRLVVRSLSGTC